ncbi:MAG: hypothetical protein Fur0020_09810 [Thermodesulfovibrionia bacterium]
MNEDVILFSEFKEAFDKEVKAGARKTEIDVINEMINKKLLLEEAKRFISADRIGDLKDDDALINEYINTKIRPFIHIPIAEVELYFMEHRDSFKGRYFYEVKDEIEAILMEGLLKQRINEYVKGLREKAYIRVQLTN